MLLLSDTFVLQPSEDDWQQPERIMTEEMMSFSQREGEEQQEEMDLEVQQPSSRRRSLISSSATGTWRVLK